MSKALFVACCAAVWLSGCHDLGGPSGARSAAPEELMRVAVPGWEANGKRSVRPIPSSGDTGTNSSFFALSPALVIKQGEDKITLIVAGSPTDEEGNPLAGHSTQAVLGAYWFGKQGDRWLKVAEQPNFGEEGYFGAPGELRPIDIGDGNTALAVENGSCWQGACMRWLTLYALHEKSMSKIYSDGISSDTEGASNSCSDLLKLAVGQSMRVPPENYSTNIGCYQITGTPKILPAKHGLGQLVIEYAGVTTHAKTVPISDETRAQYVNDGITEDAPDEEYLVTLSAIQQKQVYSFRDGRYVLVKGKNPNPGL